MVEKSVEKFELRSKLFDHAAHKGSNYLNGHCMVSILLSFPVMAEGSIRYLSVSLGYRLWDKKQTKLEIAAEMVRSAMGYIGSDRQVFLLCNSWYPKGCAAGLVDEFSNLDMICNARIDTVMYSLPPERTGKRGRPRKYGEACRQKVSRLKPQKPETGRSARSLSSLNCGERGWFMPLSLSPKVGMEAAGFSFAQKIRKASFLTTADAKMKQYAAMGKKTYSFSRSPAIRCGGISKYPTTKAKLSGHLKNTVYGAAKALSG